MGIRGAVLNYKEIVELRKKGWTGPRIAQKLKCCSSSVYKAEKTLGFKPDYFSGNHAAYKKVKMHKEKSLLFKPDFKLRDYFKLTDDEKLKFRDKVLSKMRVLARQGTSIQLIIIKVATELKVSKNVVLMIQCSTDEITNLLKPYRAMKRISIKNPNKGTINECNNTDTTQCESDTTKLPASTCKT